MVSWPSSADAQRGAASVERRQIAVHDPGVVAREVIAVRWCPRIVLRRRRTDTASSPWNGSGAAACRAGGVDVHLLAVAVGVEQERPASSRPAAAAARPRRTTAQSRRPARDDEHVVGRAEQRPDVAFARVAARHQLPGRDRRAPGRSRSRMARARQASSRRRSRASGESADERIEPRHRVRDRLHRTCRPGPGPSRSACS